MAGETRSASDGGPGRGPGSAVVTTASDGAPASESGSGAEAVRRLAALTEMVGWGLAQRLSPAFYRGLLERVAALAPECDAARLLVRGGDGRFRYAAAIGLDEALLPEVSLASDALPHDPEVLVPIEVVRHGAGDGGPRPDPHGPASRGGPTLVLPLVTGGSPLGFVYLDRLTHDEPFSAETLAVAEVAAAQASLVVQRLKLEARLRERQDELERVANYDLLTGLPNRGLFLEQLRIAVDGGRRSGRKVALLFLDLDGFKEINDTLGHEAGDALLVEVAARMQRAMRSADSVGRLGGDEFTVLVDDLDDARNAAAVADKLLAAIHEPFELRGSRMRVTASIGIAVAPDDAAEVGDLLRFADTAMYRAKALGRAGYAFFTAELDAQARARLRLVTDLREAISERRLTLAFQPQVALDGGGWVGVEALARWEHAEWGPVPATTFVRAAVESGQIHDLGRLVRDGVFETLHGWRDHPVLGRLRLSFNASADELLRGDVREGLATAVGDDPTWADRLTVELTEGALTGDGAVAAARVAELRTLGVGVALDDFGAGRSSLAEIRHLPLTVLKVDRTFVATLGVDGPEAERDAAVVRTIVALGAVLGCTVVAEGVETEAQRRALLALGCAVGQGLLLAAPMRGAELTAAADLLVP